MTALVGRGQRRNRSIQDEIGTLGSGFWCEVATRRRAISSESEPSCSPAVLIAGLSIQSPGANAGLAMCRPLGDALLLGLVREEQQKQQPECYCAELVQA